MLISWFTGRLCLAMLLVPGCAHAVGQNIPAAPNQHSCSYSNDLFANDLLLMTQRPPTIFRLMPSRYLQMVQAERGLQCLGTATIAFNGHRYNQAGMTDDAGIAELIPTISNWTGLSLARSFDLTAFLVIFLGVVIGYAGLWTAYPIPQLRWLGVGVFLGLGLLETRVANVYVFQSCSLVAGIPWVVHFARSRKMVAFSIALALLVFCCSWCSLVRIGSLVIGLAFVIPMIVARFPTGKTFLPLMLIMLACTPSILFERSLIARRDKILLEQGATATAENTHTIWHSIYIGLAFIPNTEVPEYNDRIGAEKVRSIDANVAYTSAAYDAILRQEVLRLAIHKPALLIENLVAKTGIVLLLATLLLFPSRKFLFADPTIMWIDVAFIVAMVVSAMNGILVIPRLPYLLTFLCLTSLYSSLRFATGYVSEKTSSRLPIAAEDDQQGVR